jgi:CRISPR type III-A-associated protein Csm2
MANLNDWKEFNEKKHFGEIPIESFAGQGKWSDSFMSKGHKDIRINQLRNFFGEIQVIQRNPEIWQPANRQSFKDSIAMLQMNLAYDYGRNVITREFYDMMTQSLGKITTEKDFSNFVVFVKSLIAYHKFYSANK